MKQLIAKVTSSNLVSRVRKVYIPAASGAFAVMLATANSYALTWPPTAADLGTAFGAVVTTIGEIFAAVVTAGLVLYGGVLAVQAAISYFSKFVKRSTGAA